MTKEELLPQLRIKKRFSFFWIISDSSQFITTNVFIGFVTVRERQYRWRAYDIDPFWTGGGFWGDWNYGWKYVEFIENN